MKVHRVWCVGYNCSKCENAVFIKEGVFSGDKYYTCSFNPKKHKAIDGNKCGAFRCMEYSEHSWCDKCNGGYPLKKILRR